MKERPGEKQNESQLCDRDVQECHIDSFKKKENKIKEKKRIHELKYFVVFKEDVSEHGGLSSFFSFFISFVDRKCPSCTRQEYEVAVDFD